MSEKPTVEAGRYDWTGWEAETDLGNVNDREGVWFLTIREDGEEIATIIHRGVPVTEGADRKAANAARIVEALAFYDEAKRGQL